MLKKSCTSRIKAGPIVLQLEWKKLAEKPSGPGALSGWIRNRAFLISVASGIAQILSLVAGVMLGLMAGSTISLASDMELLVLS